MILSWSGEVLLGLRLGCEGIADGEGVHRAEAGGFGKC